MIQKLLMLTVTLGLALGLSSIPIHTASAVMQLPSEFHPSNLPDIETPAAATDSDHPETAATQTLILYIGKLVSQVLLFMGSITIIFLIIAGGNYIFAFGKDSRIESGKRGLFWSLTGLLVILFSYAIVQGVISILLQVDSSTG